MSQLSVGKLLPNLKVTLGNDSVDTDSSEIKEMSIDSKVEVVRPSFDNLINPKVYVNKDGGFATGIDLIEQENSGILSKRAERFGLDMDVFKPSISSLYESMGIDVKNRDSVKMRHVRLDAIHVRGVEELNTEEVFTYFQDYGPSSIEWINDSSCNVLWFDETSCARALLALSKPLPASCSSEVMKVLKDSDDPDTSSLEPKDKTEKEEMEVDSSEPDIELTIPVPPGQWRIGVPHSKAETIVLRFATRGDKKVPGAEKRSKYYKKYGNPNYGGLKGLISNSRKHKTQAAANRWAVAKESSYKSSSSSHQSNSSLSKAPKHKTFRMRMYADDEELRTKKLRSTSNLIQKKSSVHSRLGRKYTADDLCHLGNYRSSGHTLDRVQDYDYSSKTKSSSGDLRSKLKKIRNDRTRESYAGPTYSYNRESAFENIKYKRVDELKKEKRSFYKRKHRSPLCADDDEEEEGETSSSED